jgi:hypothetical protein
VGYKVAHDRAPLEEQAETRAHMLIVLFIGMAFMLLVAIALGYASRKKRQAKIPRRHLITSTDVARDSEKHRATGVGDD